MNFFLVDNRSPFDVEAVMCIGFASAKLRKGAWNWRQNLLVTASPVIDEGAGTVHDGAATTILTIDLLSVLPEIRTAK